MFADQMENQRVKATFSDAWGSYPVIQGFSIESLLSDGQLDTATNAAAPC